MRPALVLTLACLGILLAPLQRGWTGDLEQLQSDLAKQRARKAKYAKMLENARHTKQFMVENPSTVGPGEMQIIDDQIDSCESYLAQATAAVEQLEAAVTKEKQSGGDDPGQQGGVPDNTSEGETGPTTESSHDETSKKEKSAKDKAASDHLKQSSLDGSAGKISAMTSSAQNMAGQLKTGDLSAEGALPDPKKAGMPPAGRKPAGLVQGPQGRMLGVDSPGTMKPSPETRSMDPSRPGTREELALAASAGYQGSFERLGLRVARDGDGRAVIMDRSGRPATEAQLALLRQDIASQPAALTRYPNFFSAVTPEQFQGLKQHYGEKPESRDKEFKDIELTKDDRDFKWDKSCEKVSGECNPNAQEGSYKKDDFVSPSDLDSVWDNIDKEERALAEAAQKGSSGNGPAGPAGSASADDEGILGRLGRAAASLWGGEGETDDLSGGVEASDGAAQRTAGEGPSGRMGAKGAGPAGRGPGHAQPSRRRPARGKRALLWGGALAAAGLLFFLGYKRRQASRRPFFSGRDPAAGA